MYPRGRAFGTNGRAVTLRRLNYFRLLARRTARNLLNCHHAGWSVARRDIHVAKSFREKEMKKLFVAALLTAACAGPAFAQDKEAQITQAVSPLPEMLRAGATVVSYDAKGMPVVLRQGTNNIICNPSAGGEGFAVNCYEKVMKTQNDMAAKLRAEGKDAKAVQAAMQEARAAGKLPAVPLGTASYSRFGKTEADSRVTWRIALPGATTASTGLPDKKGADGDPWLQLGGTPNAHIHIK